jgi:protein-tyrosine-phosphatase
MRQSGRGVDGAMWPWLLGSLRIVFNSILVVCLGNVCRSPVAEFLFRRELGERDIRVSSAGLGALVGRPIEKNAAELLHEEGIDASGHRARQLEPSMVRDADLILAMEHRQLKSVVRQVARGRRRAGSLSAFAQCVRASTRLNRTWRRQLAALPVNPPA